MKIVSINLRKRLGGAKAHAVFSRWLEAQAPSILVMQEAVPGGRPLPASLWRLDFVGGDHMVACWAKPGVPVALETSDIPALLIETETHFICGTYLSDRSSRVRICQLELLGRLLGNRAKPIVLAGDFNTAPLPSDGLFGNEASTWTRSKERAALQHLTNELGLIDLTSRFRLGQQHFTFERINKGKWTRFRCDLAFAPDNAAVTAYYDHGVRTGSHAFTDHSACIIEVEKSTQLATESASMAPMPASPQAAPASNAIAVRPYNTAIRRTGPSKPVRYLVESDAIKRWDVRSVLDYGCGHGADVRYLGSQGYAATGYDQHPGFCYQSLPPERFDLVLLLYVLNVLPSAEERLAVVRCAAQHLAARGRMLIVARSVSEIEREAKAKQWLPFSDGYMSDVRRKMFQHGMCKTELVQLTREAELQPTDDVAAINTGAWVIVTHNTARTDANMK